MFSHVALLTVRLSVRHSLLMLACWVQDYVRSHPATFQESYFEPRPSGKATSASFSVVEVSMWRLVFQAYRKCAPWQDAQDALFDVGAHRVQT